MKKDPIISALVNFLVPVIFLYGLFFLVGFFNIGFSSVVYSSIIFASAFMILAFRSERGDFASALQIEHISFFLLLLSICYIFALLFSITDLFSI